MGGANWKLEALIEKLKEEGVLRSEAIESALRAVDRADFVPEEFQDLAYSDQALPTVAGQTISQPYTVVFMLEHLNVQRGNVVMDVGYGSGWQTALLSHLVGEEGRVLAIERVPELCEIGKRNVEKYPNLYKRAEMACGNAAVLAAGLLARFTEVDRIIAAASFEGNVPELWFQKLAQGGVLMYPGHGSIMKMTKVEEGFKTDEFPGFAFVPFVER